RDPLGSCATGGAAGQRFPTARRHALDRAVVQANIGKLGEGAPQLESSGLDHRSDQTLQRRLEKRGLGGLLEPLLEGAGPHRPEAPHEDGPKRCEAQRLPHQKRLDHSQPEPEGARLPLAAFVPGPVAQLVDHLGREMTLQLPRYRRSLLVDLWTRRLTSCSSLLHRAPFVGRFATKPTKEWPDLFPLSRYVTRKGSGDACRPVAMCHQRLDKFGLPELAPRA